MKLLGAVLAITTLPLLACGGDDGNRRAVTWRVPCQTQGQWDSDPGSLFTTVFTYDARKHPTHRVGTFPDGTVSHTVDQVWDGDYLQSTDYVSLSLDYHAVYTWDGDHVVQTVRTDRTTDDGDDTSYVATFRYDGDALVDYDIDWANPARDDRHVTITGNRSTEEIDLDCSVQNPTQCDRSVWTQPDGDPDHWTRGTLDSGNDGTAELQWDRELDDHGLDLVYRETDLSAGAVKTFEFTYQREADGTELGHANQYFNGDGTIDDTYRETPQFTCAGARVAATGARGAAARLDAVDAVEARLPGWRGDVASMR